MTESTRCFRYEDYTVGWISAIPVELEAAIQMLDQQHYDLPQSPNGSIIYTLGNIGSHNVVIACLSAGEIGIGSAAAIATEMRTTFPCLRFGLLVGVGGGVPSAADIRLGDIIVSQPRAGQEAVVQYDFGKHTTSGFRRMKRLNPPPAILLNALSNYQARNLDTDGDLVSHRFKPKKLHPMLQKFPGPDLLFQADYHHTDGTTCKNCDYSQLSEPADRDHRCIMVHYGTIASGNQVIKDGTVRDQLSRELGGVLCFEMEAAGIMNTFPSLVIRGVCDYADSHKNKDSQRFAALAAAAYGKEFLDIMPAIQAIANVEAAETVKALGKYRHTKSSKKPTSDSAGSSHWWSDHAELVKYEFSIQSISDYHPMRTYRDFARSRCPGTTQWILENQTYLRWRGSESSTCLWLTGKIGSGKTLVTSTVIEQLIQEGDDHKPGLVLHYFYRYSYKDDLSAIAFLKSCIKQMLTHLETTSQLCPTDIDLCLRHHCNQGKDSGRFDEMVEVVFIPLTDIIDRVTLVVDGLDECNNKEILEVLKLIRTFLRKPNKRVFLSGRASLDIAKSIPESLCIEISEIDATHDISEYIRWKLDEKMLERQIVDDISVLTEIEAILLENAEQMILWVKLQIESIWEDCSGDAEIRAALKDLPKDLTETYHRCLRRISSDKGIYSRGYASKILPWMLEAVRPFTIAQLSQALAIKLDTGTIDHENIPSTQDIIRSCANLIMQNTDEQVVLAHHSVYQYLNNQMQAKKHETPSISVGHHTMPNLSANISLASLCIGHLLSEDYTLAIQQIHTGALRLESTEIARLTAVIPRSLRLFLPRPRPMQVVLPIYQPISTKTATLPDFFHYAREQWAELTRGWTVSDVDYPKLAKLALQPDLTWRLHPWKPLGQSLDSHFFSLMGWAIVNRHETLFQLLFQGTRKMLRDDIFAAPFHPYDGLNCVLLAARSNAPWVFDRIPKTVLTPLLSSEDHKGWTALHYAVDVQSTILVAKLVPMIKTLGLPIFNEGTTALEIAATRSNAEIIKILLALPWDTNARVIHNATIAAIRSGHVSLLLHSHNLQKVMVDGEAAIEAALLDAAHQGHTNVIESVLSALSNYERWSSIEPRWQKNILFAAVHSNRDIIFKLAIEKSWSLISSNAEWIFTILIEKIIQTSSSSGYQGWVTMAEELSKAIDFTAHGKQTPASLLYFAVQKNTPQEIDILLKRGVDPYQIYPNGETALQMATSTYKYDTAKILLKHLVIDKDNANEFLEIAIRINDLDLAKRLMKYGISPIHERSLSSSITLLQLASMIGGNEMFEYLLEFSGGWQCLDDLGKDCDTLLIFNARHGHSSKVKMLCVSLKGHERDTYINERDRNGRTALYHSCVNGHIACAQMLLRYGALLSILDRGGQTALHTMVQEFSDTTMEQELSHTAILYEPGFQFLAKSEQIDMDMRNAGGETALHLAVRFRNQTAIKILLDCGTDIDLQDSIDGATALYMAVQAGNQHAINELLEHGADVNVQDKTIGATALHMAVRAGRQPSIKSLLGYGADVNIQTFKKGVTALHIAVLHGYHFAATKLLEHGVDVNIQTIDKGATALHMAVQVGRLSIITVLLEHAADVNVQDKAVGATALHVAVKNGDQSATTKLLEHGADVNIQTISKGATALHMAVQVGRLSVITVLLKHAADVNIQDKVAGATALHIAVRRGDQSAVTKLLEHGADVNVQDNIEKATPVHLAAKSMFQPNECLWSLLSLEGERKASLEIQDNKGNTALHIAIMSGNAHSMAVLVAAGADKNTRNNDGVTALALSQDVPRNHPYNGLIGQ